MTMPAVPPTRRHDVVDVHHGTSITDPYRWLEADPASASEVDEVAAWVGAQNTHTQAFLDRPERAAWHARLVALMELPVVESAQLCGDTLFCQERPAGHEQLLLTRRSATEVAAPAVTLVDSATRSADAATAIDWFTPSSDGSLVAVGTSEGGTEDSILRVISATDGAVAGAPGDEIPDTRACSIAWEPDGGGFFYTRYPAGDQYHRTVHRHCLGTTWIDDPVVWRHPTDAQAWPHVKLSPDGRWLIVATSIGYSQTDIHVLDRSTDTWTTVIDGVQAMTELRVAADGQSLVGVTQVDAPRGRVVRIRLDRLADGPAAWETLVAERDDVITSFGVTSTGLMMITSRAAVDTAHRLNPDGQPVDDSVVTGVGDVVSIPGLATSVESPEFYLVIDAFEAPTQLWRVAADGAAAPHGTSDSTARVSSLTGRLAVSHIEYPSADGTGIGMFLVHRADRIPGAGTPAILTGYGGFAISRGPRFEAKVAAWCAAGGLYAVAGLRGGLEHGEEWHLAGSRANKQNVFDDFHAGADFLVDAGLTSRDRLAVHGGSNGGLLVGVALTQRPDLCRAVWCAVPLLDMIRFPNFLIARLWTPEYGDPDIAEEFGWLHAYSPYHHVEAGTCYPATLIQTAEGDTRVDPLHARKMVALLQASTSCLDERPIVLFQEGRAGHGVGKPVAKRADEVANGLTFVGAQLGVAPAAS